MNGEMFEILRCVRSKGKETKNRVFNGCKNVCEFVYWLAMYVNTAYVPTIFVIMPIYVIM